MSAYITDLKRVPAKLSTTLKKLESVSEANRVSGDFSHIVGWNIKAGPCVGGALGAAVIRLVINR